jgi:phosphatidylserine/phosphatidylglycerophosphate/cardiolipin synthase-like enzyme
VAVRRFCGPAPAAAVAAWLQLQHDDGMPPRHLAPAAEAVDLVWTGPGATGVTNRDTWVLVAGFAIAQGRDVFRPLAERMAHRPGLRVRLPELYYDTRSLAPGSGKRSSLHAKCVVVDRRVAFVTSANFTEAAQTRNLEVGALIRCERFAAQLAGHFADLVEVQALRPLAGDGGAP